MQRGFRIVSPPPLQMLRPSPRLPRSAVVIVSNSMSSRSHDDRSPARRPSSHLGAAAVADGRMVMRCALMGVDHTPRRCVGSTAAGSGAPQAPQGGAAGSGPKDSKGVPIDAERIRKTEEMFTFGGLDEGVIPKRRSGSRADVEAQAFNIALCVMLVVLVLGNWS